jgi:hypothetical protein
MDNFTFLTLQSTSYSRAVDKGINFSAETLTPASYFIRQQ